MRWNLKRTVDPVSAPVSVDEVKDQSRITESAENALVNRLINAAVESIEGPYGIGVCLEEQTWELALDCFPSRILIPLYPVISVESIEYEDTNGVTQTVADSVYRVDTHSNPARITQDPSEFWPATRDAANAVTVTFKAGYPNGAPEDLKHAIIMLAAHWYENREAAIIGTSATETPMAVNSILDRYRVMAVG